MPEPDGFVRTPFIDPWTDEQRAAYEAKQAAALAKARDRFRLALVTAGVPVEDAADVLAGLEAQGYRPRIDTSHGVLNGGMLYAEPGNPNAVGHEHVVLQQEWQPVESPPDPPFLLCRNTDHEPFRPTCLDEDHTEHVRGLYSMFHRATPAEVEQLRQQQEQG